MATPLDSLDSVEQYFDLTVYPGLAQRPDDGDKAVFLNGELEKWERAEQKLGAWASRDDGSPNPYSPPLDAFQIARILGRLDSMLERLRIKIRNRITEQEKINAPG